MTNNENDKLVSDEFSKLLDKSDFKLPQIGETIKGKVVAASKAEVRLDIDGILMGVVRGPELYEEDDSYANLKPGEEVEATVVDGENENGELELSFRYAGQEKAWQNLKEAFKEKKIVKIKIVDANKGGLMARFRQISGFLPVSQLAPENYPRVSGGDKGKILEKLKSFVGQEFNAKVITLDEKEDKIIFSEKDVWSEAQKDIISKYKVGDKIEGDVIAVTDFGVFVGFDKNMEGLIHISELAWQRIDSPSDLYKVGDKISAEIINIDGAKIFLSAKKLIKDPWQDLKDKYKEGQVVKGEILKVNPFGLFVQLDKDIHGLAHITQLGLKAGEKIEEKYKAGTSEDFQIMTIEPNEHRMGLKLVDEKNPVQAEAKPAEEATDKSENKPAEKKKESKPKEAKKKTVKKTKKEEKEVEKATE